MRKYIQELIKEYKEVGIYDLESMKNELESYKELIKLNAFTSKENAQKTLEALKAIVKKLENYL